MKKCIALILTLTLVLPVLNVLGSASFAETDTPRPEAGVSRIQASAMQKLMDLGIFSKTDADNMKLDQAVSREEFAAILIRLNGQEDKLTLYQNRSSYSDVPADRWSSLYIKAAVSLGYLTVMPDGLFHPTDTISFSLAATVFGKLLGYNDDNMSGSYPQNYLTMLSNLGIFDDIAWSSAGTVTRGQMAVMILRLFPAEVYGTGKAFVETLSNYKWAIILENSVTVKNGDDRRIVTDKGTYYLREGLDVPQAGKRYFLRIKAREVQYACQDDLVYRELSVHYYGSGIVTTNEGEKVTVPAGIPCYYKGAETDLDAVSGSIQANSSIIIGYDANEAVYMAIFDPVYSEPEVIKSLAADTLLETKYGGITIEKNGKFIGASGIELNDVLYRVTDIWGNHPYIIVYDKSVSGKITAILPNRISPSVIEVDGTKYTLASSFVKEKLSTTSTFEGGKPVTVILDADGNAVDIMTNVAEGTEAYCLVLNAWSENYVRIKNSSATLYYVTLLHANGDKKTYITESSMSDLVGKLAVYSVTETDYYNGYDIVRLTGTTNNASGYYKVNKDDRMLNDDYVADGAVLFNIVNKSSAEIQASVISFEDLPSGYLTDGKVKYIHRSGDFNDIEVMLLEDALDEKTAYGMVIRKTASGTSASGATLSILVNGQTMNYTTSESGYDANTIVKVRLNGNSIAEITQVLAADAVGYRIEAADSTRIKVGGKVYPYSKHISIYKFDSQSGWKMLQPEDLYKDNDVLSVAIYLDKPAHYGGRVVAVLII